MKDKMKIVMFGHKRIPSREGGIEIVVEQIATRLVQRGHDVICYNRGGHHVCGEEYDIKGIKEYKGIKIKSVTTIDKKGLAAVTSSFFAGIKSAFSSADIVHIHAEGPAIMSWLPRLFGKKVVVTIHGLDWQREKWKNGFGSKYIKLGEKIAVKYADEIIVLSEGVKEYFKSTYNRETVVIPNGVEKPVIKPCNQIREKFNLKKDSYILFLGRLVPEKGIHYLIDAFRKTKTDKYLVIAGGASDTDEYINQLYNRAKKDKRIIFTGFVQGEILEELYSNAYIYVLPSDLEGMPLSLLEAMSYGNCCVVSDIEECTQVIGDTGRTFSKSNSFSLMSELQYLCENEEIVRRYKERASEYICAKYNWDDITEKTEDIYK